MKNILLALLITSTPLISYGSTIDNEDETEVSDEYLFDLSPPTFELFDFNIESSSITDDLYIRQNYEDESDENPFSLTTHKMNYILPYTYGMNINRDVYSKINDFNVADGFQNEEAKFQLSLKFPIVKSVFNDDDRVYFGFTMKSYWQIYAPESSRPFRNTDYNPEIFYTTPILKSEDRDTFIMVGFEHESNGQIQYLSRSWNRLYTSIGTGTDDYAVHLKTWVRISEESKEYEFDPSGDDNPDIQDYYGNAELTLLWRYHKFQYSAMGRQNFSTGKGFLELGATFPLYKNIKGYIQYTNGYGESLLDYNFYQRRIGFGVVFSDLL